MWTFAEAEVRSSKKVVLKISQNLLENTCVGSLFNNNVAGQKTCNYVKKRLQRSCFPVNIAKFLKTPFL